MVSYVGVVCAVVLALLQGSRSLLVTASKTAGSYAYSPEAVLLAQELLKLVIAVGLLGFGYLLPKEKNKAPTVVGKRINTQFACVLYCIPALCYAAQNLIVFYALLYIDPPTFQLFTQLKIVTTAFGHVFFQHKPLSSSRWLAVVILLIASLMGQWQNLSSGTGVASHTTIGLLLSLTYCLLSTMSGIIRESLLKSSDIPMSLQQVIIYIWSVGINATICTIFHPDQKLIPSFDALTWAVIINGAALGHITGAVAFYANNLVSAFATSLSLFLSTGFSVYFFATNLSLGFVCGCFLACVSLVLYANDGKSRKD